MSISQIPSGWTITRSDERIVVQHVSGAFYAAAKEGESGIAESILYMLADSLLSATLSPAHIEDGEEVEVVGYRYVALNVKSMSAVCQQDHPPVIPMVEWSAPEPLMTVAQHQRIVADLKVNLAMAMDAATKGDVARQQCGGMEMEIAELRAALSAPPAAGVPIGMACTINGYWEAQLFAGHGCIDRQSLYAHPLPPADVPTGLAHRLLKAYDHGDTGAIEAAIEDIRTMLAAAPTPPASEQQRAVVMPEGKLLVSAEPLRKVLFALLGAPHHIRELQATRTPTDLFADNPINVLIAELNAAQGGDA